MAFFRLPTPLQKAQMRVAANLAKNQYPPLPRPMSEVVRGQYRAEMAARGIPEHPEGPMRLSLGCGAVLASAYTRVVVGDYGAHFEFAEAHLEAILNVPSKQNRRMSAKVQRQTVWPLKYEWWQPASGEKVYLQRGLVRYADYRIGMYYVSVNDVALQ